MGTAGPPEFWVGSPEASWPARFPGCWCVSANRLRRVRRVQRIANGSRVVIDSGGFTEIATHGRWTVSPEQYVDEIRTWTEQWGRASVRWAATQDWMCEREMLATTGLTVEHHQHRTVESYLRLRELAPEIPWLPTIQGDTPGDYLRCVQMFRGAGVDLRTVDLVGIGSVCRRAATRPIEGLIRQLAADGIKLHGFGVKTTGIKRLAAHIASSDSMAWSAAARRRRVRLQGCSHATCANCPRWAGVWGDMVREQIASAIDPAQLCLF